MLWNNLCGGINILWNTGVVEDGCCGIRVLWNKGGLWNSPDNVLLWNKGVVEYGCCGIRVVWNTGVVDYGC